MIKSLLRKLYFVPSPTLNLSAKSNMIKIKNLVKDRKNPIILNLGCGERFIGREILEKSYKILNLDIYPFPGVEIIADAHKLPFKNETFDVVICQAVLEHTKAPWLVVDEIFRILKKEGIVYAEIPFLQGFHPSPTDFYRFTIQGAEQLFCGFEKLDLDVCVGPSSTLSWILREYICGILSFFSEKRLLRGIGYFISSWITFPIKYFDFFFFRRPLAHRISSGIYFIGKK